MISSWFSIWVHPKVTIRRIVERDPGFRFAWLSLIYGFPALMQFAQTTSLGLYFSWSVLLIASLVFATFIGMLGITITSVLLTWVGRWIGGRGAFSEIRAAVAWSNVPAIITGLTWLLWVFYFRDVLFFEGLLQQDFSGVARSVIVIAGTVQFVVSVWSFVLLLATLSEVQRFSAWKAVFNVMLPFILVVVALWIVMWGFWVIKSLF